MGFFSKADYTYEIREYSGRNIIAIEDLDLGNISVTNDIENVIRDIQDFEKINAKQYLILYKDSTGSWDGYDPKGKNFIPLTEDTCEDAVNKYINLQLTNDH